MYQPGLDNGLAKVRYAEMLQAAANERADRKARAVNPKPAARRLVLALAAAAPIVIGITWMLVAH